MLLLCHSLFVNDKTRGAHLWPPFCPGLELIWRWREEQELKKAGERDAEAKGESGHECRQKLVLRRGDWGGLGDFYSYPGRESSELSEAE